MPTVSVILPLYNKAQYVERALTSISHQTFSDLEIIVVDDGSTDDGLDMVSRYIDPRLRVFVQGNAGPGAARNRGISESLGTYVAFLDADDAWADTFLERGVAALEAAGSAVATHTCSYLDEPGGRDSSELWYRRGLRPGTQRVTPDLAPEALLHRVAFMSPCTTIARASVLRRFNGFYAEGGCRYAEDAHLWLRILLNEEVSFSLESLVHIHRDASHLSATTRYRRPLEPFLARPETVRVACPAALESLLNKFLTIRAYKSACAWAYWGDWREARDLARRFHSTDGPRLPFYWRAKAAATPLGAIAGATVRGMRGMLEGARDSKHPTSAT